MYETVLKGTSLINNEGMRQANKALVRKSFQMQASKKMINQKQRVGNSRDDSQQQGQQDHTKRLLKQADQQKSNKNATVTRPTRILNNNHKIENAESQTKWLQSNKGNKARRSEQANHKRLSKTYKEKSEARTHKTPVKKQTTSDGWTAKELTDWKEKRSKWANADPAKQSDLTISAF